MITMRPANRTPSKGPAPRRRANHLYGLGRSPAQMRLARAEIIRAEKLISRALSTHNAELPSCAQILFFRFYRNRALLRSSCLAERDARAVVTMREAGMRWPCRVAA
jgi:hypothetical protein